MESVPTAYVPVDCRAGKRNPIPTRFLAPIDCLKIPAQGSEIRKQTDRIHGHGHIFRRTILTNQRVTKRCRLSWLTNSALVYESNVLEAKP
jgi:hypothetical protein